MESQKAIYMAQSSTKKYQATKNSRSKWPLSTLYWL